MDVVPTVSWRKLLCFFQENFTCQEKASPLPSISGLVSRASFDTDLENTLDDPVSKSSNVIFDAPIPSAVIEICSVLQFSINDLRRRRICGMPKMCFTNSKLERLKTKRSQIPRLAYWLEKPSVVLYLDCNFISNHFDIEWSSLRSYAAATLDDSQPENDEAKAKALAAATSELDRLFRKEDFEKMKVVYHQILFLIHVWDFGKMEVIYHHMLFLIYV